MLLQIYEPGQTPLPHETDPSIAIGIDLGTTHSVLAYADHDRVNIIEKDGQRLIPSIVTYLPDGTIQIGVKSLAGAISISSIKRLMGRSFADLNGLNFPQALEGEGGSIVLNIFGQKKTPLEICAEILKEIKARASDAFGRPVEQAVITVPAYFDDAARTATKDAAALAGIKVLRLINEPTAAALAYGLDEGLEGTYLIYDLGGGTFDISLLKMEKGVFQVLATGGDHQLGGDDLDYKIAAHFGTVNPESLTEARQLKETLSTQDTIDSPFFKSELSKETLEKITGPLIEKTVSLTKKVVQDAGLALDQLKGIVLVGGSTRMPMIVRRLKEEFGYEPSYSLNPDEVVAVGAALQAKALVKGADHVLLDVNPLSLSIETAGGLIERIIPRNSAIPVAKAQDFTTGADGQNAMMIHVVQGEREFAADNRSLARFDLKDIPPMTAGMAKVRVTFNIDADGILTVSAKELTTGHEQKIEVKPSYGLQDQDMIQMLRQSMEHAKDDMEKRLWTETRVEAERLAHAMQVALVKDGDLLNEKNKKELENHLKMLQSSLEEKMPRDKLQEYMNGLEAASRDFIELRVNKAVQIHLAGQKV